MPVAEVLPGFVEAATLMAPASEGGGVKINVVQQNVSNYFTTSGGYLHPTLAFDYTGTSLSMTQQFLAVMWAKAAYNDTHWGQQAGGAAADRKLFAAIGATDHAKAQEAVERGPAAPVPRRRHHHLRERRRGRCGRSAGARAAHDAGREPERIPLPGCVGQLVTDRRAQPPRGQRKVTAFVRCERLGRLRR